MSLPDEVRLRHICDAAREAIHFVQGKSRPDLDSNDMLSLALVRLLEIIGEAANGVSPELREKYPAIHWTGMTGMRNWLIHGYFDVNLDIVWQTVTKDLPPLAAQIERVLRESVEN
jgi:uncharacterized protein with HEPN domain